MSIAYFFEATWPNSINELRFFGLYPWIKGKYNDSYQMGKTWKVDDPNNVKITNTDVGRGKVMIVYKFTDIYGQEYWTPALKL